MAASRRARLSEPAAALCVDVGCCALRGLGHRGGRCCHRPPATAARHRLCRCRLWPSTLFSALPPAGNMAAQGKPASAEMQNFLVQQQAKAQLQQTISRLTDECWGKCVGNPGKSAPCCQGCYRPDAGSPAAVQCRTVHGKSDRRGGKPPPPLLPCPADCCGRCLLSNYLLAAPPLHCSPPASLPPLACMDNCARRFLESTQFVVRLGRAGGAERPGSAVLWQPVWAGWGLAPFLARRLDGGCCGRPLTHTQYVCAAALLSPAGQVLPVKSRRRRRPAQRLLRRRLEGYSFPLLLACLHAMFLCFLFSISCLSR